MNNLRKNILASYASQLYVTLAGILLLPLYIQYMGAEAYGLVGFFTMLQAWFSLLDLGLTPTISRETARYRGGALSPLKYSQLFRSLSLIFCGVAFIGGIILFTTSTFIASEWISFESLSFHDVVTTVQIMSISIALRWMCGLYRGVVSGSEMLVWLSCFNSLVATLRFVGVLIAMWYFGFTIIVFFLYQLAVAVIEITVLAIKAYVLLPKKKLLNQKIGWSFKPVRPVLKFSLTIAFTASISIIVTQTDKLVLSGILTLKDYGYFTLAVLVANGIMIIGGPIAGSIMPRMAKLYAEGNNEQLLKIYRQSTRLVTIIAGTAALTIVVVAKPLLLAWTGNLYLAEQAAPILQLYALGNGILVIGAFPYYLQFAKGNLRYHLIGNLCMVVILIPAIIYAAMHYGGIGAGFVWLSVNVLYFLIWVPFVHYKLEPGLHLPWLKEDVLKIIFPVFILVLCFIYLDKIYSLLTVEGQMYNFLLVIIVSFLTLSCTLIFSKDAKNMLASKFKSK